MYLILGSVYQWFQRNLDVVFFIYGLAFVIMGIAISAQPKKESEFKLSKILWILAVFGLIHGSNELLDMWAIIKGRSPVLDIVRSVILIVSYFFLFEFGRHFFCICGQKYLEKIAKLFGWLLTLIIGLAVFIFSFLSIDFWKIGTIWARYLLGFSSGLLISLSLVMYYKYKEKELEPIKAKKYFFSASWFFLAYGILSGLIVPKADFFPANVINTDSFLSVVHIPVQVFRTFCAVMITWSICGILRIFNWETVEKFRREVRERKLAKDALQKAYDDLELRIQERTKELTRANGLLRSEIVNHKEAVEVARVSENKYRTLIENLPQKIFLKDRNSVYLSCNENYARNLKISPDEIIGRTDYEFFLKELAEKYRADDKRIMDSGEMEEIEERYVRNGQDLIIDTVKIPVKDEKNNTIGILGIFWDITGRRKAQEELENAYARLKETQDQLIQAEKLSAIGLLASGVAHEVRNPLGIIIQGVNYLEKRISAKEEDIHETLVMLKDSVKRADKVINGLLDFSRATALNLQPEDINSILENSLSLIRNQFKFEHIEIARELKTDIPKVLIDRNKIEQVCINLLINAAQAMPKGGKIIIRSYDKQLEEIKNGISKGDEDYFIVGEKAVIVEFEDTGIGIPKESISKIFDPFFTTKGPRGGTGLGLSVSQSILHMHKGLIYAESQLGKGTKVTLVLKIA
jgi:PAS domain S-box-containing protein